MSLDPLGPLVRVILSLEDIVHKSVGICNKLLKIHTQVQSAIAKIALCRNLLGCHSSKLARVNVQILFILGFRNHVLSDNGARSGTRSAKGVERDNDRLVSLVFA